MFQKSFKKSTVLKMGILRNACLSGRQGCRTRRSLSPVMMQEAFTETTSSKNLSSFGIRHSVIISVISINTASSYFFKANNFSSEEIYLSNFGRNKISLNSLYVLRLAKTYPSFTAFSNAFLGLEYLNIKALTKVLVTITNKLFLIQQFFQDFFCKAVFYRLITDSIKQGKDFILFHATGKNFYLFFNIFFKLPLYFRRCLLPFFSGSIINFDYYLFHNFSFLSFSKIQKNNL